MSGGNADFLFRKAALDRLQSPEQLDQAITITNRRSWIALAAGGLLALLLLVWSIFGALPVRVEGQGILISAGGRVSDAVATSSGTLVIEGVGEGDRVRRGQVLASVRVPDLAERAANSIERARALEQSSDQAHREGTAIAAARRDNLAAQLRTLELAASAADQRAQTYSDQLEAQRGIFERGFVTKQSLQRLQEEVANARQAAADARSRMLELRASQLAAFSAESRQEAERVVRTQEARQSADALRSELRRASSVISPAAGQLIEWKAASGTYVTSGTSIASIASGASELQFTMFLAAADGKRVQPGMEVRIEVDGLPREQWGTLVGKVSAISRFPATREGMLAIVRNEALVTRLSSGGAPFIARISLRLDRGSPSGYFWSGGPGPGSALSGGTTGKARVTILHQRPISYVTGFLRKASGA